MPNESVEVMKPSEQKRLVDVLPCGCAFGPKTLVIVKVDLGPSRGRIDELNPNSTVCGHAVHVHVSPKLAKFLKEDTYDSSRFSFNDFWIRDATKGVFTNIWRAKALRSQNFMACGNPDIILSDGWLRLEGVENGLDFLVTRPFLHEACVGLVASEQERTQHSEPLARIKIFKEQVKQYVKNVMGTKMFEVIINEREE